MDTTTPAATVIGTTLKSSLLQGITTLALIIILVSSLFLIQYGLDRLTQVTGEDLAIPGDTVGELDIVSTRHVALRPEGLLWIAVGIGISLGGLWIGKRIQMASTPTTTPTEP